MSKLPADDEPDLAVPLALFLCQRPCFRSAGSRGLPAGQFLVAALCIGMAQAVHLGESGPAGIALVDAYLLPVVAIARDQGTAAGQTAGSIEQLPLDIGADRDGSLAATLRPAGLEDQVIAAVGEAWLELHRLFPAQAEGLLQFQAHTDMLVAHLVQLLLGNGFSLGHIGYETPVRDTVVLI